MNRAPAERTVTILGATGSIGASTVDLLKRERNRFRIEALSANKNAAARAAIARTGVKTAHAEMAAFARSARSRASLVHVLPQSAIPPPTAISKARSPEPESRRLRAKAGCSRRPSGRRNG